MDLSLFKPLNTVNIKDEFVLCIEELILAGKLLPGDRLPSERELAAHYEVSRPLIHEGILTLENRGLVTLRPRHGVVINNYMKEATLDLLLSLLASKGHNPGPKIHLDMQHFRIHMEKDIISLICTKDKLTNDEIQTLIDANDRMSAAETPALLSELDFQFHLQLGLLCENALYPLLLNTLKPAHTEYLTQFYQDAGIREKVVLLHTDLITALKNRDAAHAEALIIKIDSYESYED